MTWISIGRVAKYYGVSTQTIRNWSKLGHFKFIRTLGNHRRFSKEEIEEKLRRKAEEKNTICYSRVSANDQKQDLERQKKELVSYCQKNEITKIQEISEIGSGPNYKKRDLKKLIQQIMENKVERVVVSYRDRLIRFGLEIIEQVCLYKNVSIVVINEKPKAGFEQELATDIISVLTVFCAKIYEKRSHEQELSLGL